MSGIVGICKSGEIESVSRMLDKIAHRGKAGRAVIQSANATLGVVWTQAQQESFSPAAENCFVQDIAGRSHFARAKNDAGKDSANPVFVLERDYLGVAPLYYARLDDGRLCFASEVKALLDFSKEIHELLPGHRYAGHRLENYYTLAEKPSLTESPECIAAELRKRLEGAVKKRIALSIGEKGAWLSGGLDSSIIVALACRHLQQMHTFVAGLKNSSDLEYAREAASYLKTRHYEVVFSIDDALSVLPQVIFHLESFDALLVRSSISNYLAAQKAGEYVQSVFSGEGGDELFAGYDYLKDLPGDKLESELIDITSKLHNTALQRVDRMASAHGLTAHVPFLVPDVAQYALQIPAKYKLHGKVEKWILRQAASNLLPERVLNRRKVKFWQGSGIGGQLSAYAEKNVTDSDFRRERKLKNGWILNTKEELMYYRIFKEHFGLLENLSWMGRTKGAPVS